MSNQPRKPKGTPVGGQFDRTLGGGAATTLGGNDDDFELKQQVKVVSSGSYAGQTGSIVALAPDTVMVKFPGGELELFDKSEITLKDSSKRAGKPLTAKLPDSKHQSPQTVSDYLDGLGEDLEISGNNFEVYEQDGSVYATFCGPDNATVPVEFGADEIPLLTESEINNRVADALDSFNADEEFDELWSREFGQHNGFTPSRFLGMLQADEEHFKAAAKALRKGERI